MGYRGKRKPWSGDRPSLPCVTKMEIWIPGRPKGQSRARAQVSKNGIPFMRPPLENKERAYYIREVFKEQLCENYPYLEDYLPMTTGHIVASMAMLYPAPKDPNKWWRGKPYTAKPDYDNLLKMVLDALSEGNAGRPPMLVKDDAYVIGGPTYKLYHDPTWREDTGDVAYPDEPGSNILFTLFPATRHPKYLPANEALCPVCKKNEFTSLKQFERHRNKCVAGVLDVCYTGSEVDANGRQEMAMDGGRWAFCP